MGDLKNENLSFLNRGPYNFRVEAASVCGFSGASGAGKTLLLRAIADLEPHSGNIFLNNNSSEDFTGPQWRRKVSYLAAESFWWYEQVGQHFAVPLEESILNQLGFSSEVLQWEISRLSSGEKQRLALLRILQNSPEALLLDEPTASLDQKNVAVVEKFICNYVKEANAACIWVSHDLDQLHRVATCRYEMLAGGELRQIP